MELCDSDSEVTSNRKWKFYNSDSEVTSNRFWKFVLKESSKNSTDSFLCIPKWEFCNSDSEVTSNRFWRFLLKEGSENSTDSLSVTSKEEYSSILLLSLQWVFLQSIDKYSPWNLSWSCCFHNPVKVLVNYGSTVRWFGSAIQIPWRSIVSWDTSIE